jgi:DNA-binding transcriptional LysR family regulator
MELRQLKYFVTVAEELNFRRAAEKLYMEQPPLSRQIRKLEEELKVELFHRSKKFGVSLTDAGQALLNEAKLTLAQAERAAQAAQQTQLDKKLTIGFSICTFNQLLPNLVQTFCQQFPDVNVTLTEMSQTEQIKALIERKIDIGFLYAPISHKDIQTFTMHSESLLVALPPDHPMADREKIELRSLADEPFLLCPESVKPELYSQILQLCAQAGFQPKIVQEASPPEVLLGLVASGMGISLIVANVKTRHNAEVVYRPLTVPTPILEIVATWHNHSNSPVLNNFLVLAKQIQGTTTT